MLQNYLIIALRNLNRNFRYVLINVVGLGIALGFGILTFQNYRFSTSYDQQHTKGDRVVRIEPVKADNGAVFGLCPSPIALEARQQMADVETAVRLDSRRVVVKQDEHVFNETIHFADTDFFGVFDFPLIRGSADLSDPSRIIISRQIATKYFGDTDPVGKTLTLYADQTSPKPLVVGGVMDGQAMHSSVRFDFLTQLNNQQDGGKPVDYTNWQWRVDAVFLLLKSPAAIPAVQTALAQLLPAQQSADPKWKISRLIVEPLSTLAGNARDLRANALYPTPPPSATWGTLVMAALILLTASLNFANMTIAVCNRRLREIGVRKVMGSSQAQLIGQLLAEAGVICALAVGLGLVLTQPIIDWYNSTWPYMAVTVDYRDPILWAFLTGILLFTTLLAGSYPAFYVSAFRATHIFRGTLQFGNSGLFSRVMMGTQVAISLAALVVGVSFERNAEFNRTADVGYDRHNLIGAYVYDEANWRVLKAAIQRIPHIEAVGGTQHLPGFSYTNANFDLRNEQHEAMLYNVGDDFTKLLRIDLREGQPLLPNGDNQATQTVLVNETFVREFGEGKPLVGQTLQLDSATYRIGGIVRDFMTNTPFRPITSAIIRPIAPRQYAYFIARVPAAHQKAVFLELQKTWKRLFPYKPFDGFYQDQALAEAEDVSKTVAHTMGVFAMITVLLAVSGLFSLISLNVLKRVREVAIRRVLGATGTQIGWLLNKSYVWVLVVAIVTGCSGGYLLGLSLMNSIFKMNNGIPTSALVFSAIGVVGVAFFTILLKLWQTLRINPADSLKAD